VSFLTCDLFGKVLNAAKELLTESAHKALNDPEILDHSMEFATDVVGDNILQKTSGEALRNTVTYAVRPSLSACKCVCDSNFDFSGSMPLY
jgi:hypothetical protein